MGLPDLRALTSAIENFKLDPSDIADQEAIPDIIDWYMSRFQMFIDDGCDAAINCYLDKMLTDSRCNTITRSIILNKLYALQCEEKKEC